MDTQTDSIARPETVAVRLIRNGFLRMDQDGTVWRLRKELQSGTFICPTPYRVGSRSKLGYCQFRIRVNGKGVNVSNHRVMWWLHNGPIPKGKEINHKNGIKHDNRIENLELVTHSENTRHAYRTGLSRPLRSEQSSRAVLSWEKVREIRRLWESGEANHPTIAKMFGVTQNAICMILNNKRWIERT